MIIRSSPPAEHELKHADQAWFESDADTNDAAIREIDTEAARHGLARVNEYWLQTRRTTDGKVVRRGFCYRPGESDIDARLAQQRRNDPIGTSSNDVVRELRDTGT